MPVQPSDDRRSPDRNRSRADPTSSASPRTRSAPGLAVAQGSLYFSAVEVGGEGRRHKGKKLGRRGVARDRLARRSSCCVAILAQLGVLPLKSPTESFAECARPRALRQGGHRTRRTCSAATATAAT